MHPIRIAAQLHPQHGDYPALRAGIVDAERLGYDIAFTWDHFFPLYGDPAGASLECWTVLAAWAEATERIELGPLVACNSYRNPDLLADMARTVDRIADGRVILGLGSGWARRDYDAYGYPFGTAGSRLADLATALPRIRGRLQLLAPPPPRPMPILIGGTGLRRTLRLVAEHADQWHAGFPSRPEELLAPIDALRAWCREVGRDPGTIEWSVGVEPDDLDRFLREDAAAYLGLGFTGFTLGFNGPAWRVERGRDWLDWRDEQRGQRITPVAGTAA
jgi:probable F420-dependent oxidoreductase